MADNQQQNGSQQFENTEGQQQQHLNGTADNSSTNNDSGQFECVRDDDRSEEIDVHNRVNRFTMSDTYVQHMHPIATRRYSVFQNNNGLPMKFIFIVSRPTLIHQKQLLLRNPSILL